MVEKLKEEYRISLLESDKELKLILLKKLSNKLINLINNRSISYSQKQEVKLLFDLALISLN